jgi:hypothetical protein
MELDPDVYAIDSSGINTARFLVQNYIQQFAHTHPLELMMMMMMITMMTSADDNNDDGW